MKKILLIGAILVSCIFCLNVNAEENYNKGIVDDNYYDLFEHESNSLYFWGYPEEGKNFFFSENEEINPNIVMDYIAYDMGYILKEYANCEESTVPGTEEIYDRSCKFEVPADVFEGLIKKRFNVTDEYIKNNIEKNFNSDYEFVEQNGEKLYKYEIIYGGFGEDKILSELGYKSIGNNYYEIYSILEEYDELYKPTENDVYGKDYVLACYEYIDEDENSVTECDAAKIMGYVKTKVYYDGEFVKFISFEKIEAKDVPALKELVVEKTPKIEFKNEEIQINAPEGAFIEGTKIISEKHTSGNIYEITKKALEKISQNFVVYEINAKAEEYNVEPNKKVSIKIKLPEGYNKASIYYISEDGKAEKVETKIENGYALAEVEHFSTYALVKEESKVEKVVESVVDNPKTGLVGIGGITLIAAGGTYIYNKTRKKNKFPQD